MRKNQVSIVIDRLIDEFENGQNKQTIRVSCDSNNIWEALTGAFYETVSEITKIQNPPGLGRREHYKEKAIGFSEVLDLEGRNSEENKSSLKHIEPFEYDADPIKFLMKNKFRIDWGVFAKEATDSEIEKIKEQMPKGSELHLDLKGVANKAIYPNGSTRGISYDFLVKVIAGFSAIWGKEN